MIAHLADDSESLTVTCSADPATNPTFMVSATDGRNPVGSLTGDAEKILIAGHAAEAIGVNSVLIHNKHNADVSFVVDKKVSSTNYRLHNVTLPAGATFYWSEETGPVISTGGSTPLSSNGAVADADTIVANEGGMDTFHKTVLTLTDVPITVGNTTGISFGNVKLYDFPQGRIFVLGVTLEDLSVDLTDPGNVTPIAAGHGGDVALGTTGTSDSTLDGTDVDLLPSTSIDPISDGIAGAALAAAAQFDGTTTAKDCYLNMIIDDADVADGASDVLLISGTITIHWIFLGDY